MEYIPGSDLPDTDCIINVDDQYEIFVSPCWHQGFKDGKFRRGFSATLHGGLRTPGSDFYARSKIRSIQVSYADPGSASKELMKKRKKTGPHRILYGPVRVGMRFALPYPLEGGHF